MQINYLLGYENLKKYGQSLGANNILVGGDNYGFITVDDSVIYLKELYNFINKNDKVGKELQSYFLAAKNNYLNITDLKIDAAHPSTNMSEIYHEMGIIYDKNPYIVVILTREGKNDVEKMVKDINLKIYELHKLYTENRKNYCNKKVYGK